MRRMGMTLGKVINAVILEYVQACENYKKFNSAHEGFAVLLEEMDELKAEIWKNPKRRDMDAMRREAVQVTAMAIRFLTDICREEGKK